MVRKVEHLKVALPKDWKSIGVCEATMEPLSGRKCNRLFTHTCGSYPAAQKKAEEMVPMLQSGKFPDYKVVVRGLVATASGEVERSLDVWL